MDLVGKMLAGRYEILEEIGKGGMAYVYKARCHFLNRYVAVKVLKDELKDDKEFVHRFNTEAQAAARISNPHVVSIFDVGFENGLYYIVMEYVEGITLKEYISKNKSMPWQTAAEFAAQICEGLDAAHKKSVIHRDIKPQNIIMTKGNVLKITDFGIARATSQATTTAANSTIGTVHYLSPEQARGGYTNEQTDIYSLGVVLYEMLTGRLPFDDNTAVAIAIKHIKEKPVMPRIIKNDIPESVEKIVLKAMNKEQSLRYATAADFLKDLRAVIQNPNIKIEDSAAYDDIESTRKCDLISDDDIAEYDRQKRKTTSKYDDYANEVDEEMEESRLRNLDRRRAMREQKKKERRITIIAVLAALAVIVGMGFAFSYMTGGIFTGGEKTEIPSVVDMKLEDAQKQYRSRGISIIMQSEKTSDKESGTILEQDPPAGKEVSADNDIIIRVVVSKGNVTKKLGDYTKLKVDEAKKKIAEDGFKINIVEKESSSEKKDIVISQEPAEGTELSEGGLVTIYVSLGDGKDDKDNENSSETNTQTRPSNNNNASNNNSNGDTKTDSKKDNGTGSGTTGSADNNSGGNTTGGNNSTTTAPAAPGISN